MSQTYLNFDFFLLLITIGQKGFVLVIELTMLVQLNTPQTTAATATTTATTSSTKTDSDS